jgi:hypothetical protein
VVFAGAATVVATGATGKLTWTSAIVALYLQESHCANAKDVGDGSTPWRVPTADQVAHANVSLRVSKVARRAFWSSKTPIWYLASKQWMVGNWMGWCSGASGCVDVGGV